MKPKRPIRRISKRRARELSEYGKLRESFLQSNTICHICGIRFSTDIHHSLGRTGVLLNDIRFWIASCRECHAKCHSNPSWARLKGYSKDRLAHE